MSRLGMTLPVADEPLRDEPDLVDRLAAVGYTDLWTGEVAATDAFAPLLVAAVRRPDLRLGTSIAGVFNRTPALLAMNALGLAELASDPVYIGIGASSENMVAQWHGVAYVRPYHRVRDTARFLRLAFDGDRVTVRSTSFDIDGFRLARIPPHRPRILIAALRERMLRLAGEEADGAVLNWLSPDDVARVVPYVLDRNPGADVVARIFVVSGSDRAGARDLARRQIAAYLNTGVYASYHAWLGRGPALEPMWAAWRAGDRRGAVAAIPDAVVDDLFLSGDEAQIRSGIQAYVRAGVTIPVLSIIGPDADEVRALALRLPGPGHGS